MTQSVTPGTAQIVGVVIGVLAFIGGGYYYYANFIAGHHGPAATTASTATSTDGSGQQYVVEAYTPDAPLSARDDRVAVRSAPRADAPVLQTLQEGRPIAITGRVNGASGQWMTLQLGYNTRGYVSMNDLVRLDGVAMSSDASMSTDTSVSTGASPSAPLAGGASAQPTSANAPPSAYASATSLGGSWSGQYEQNGQWTAFSAELNPRNGGFSGRTSEQGVTGGYTVTRTAELNGQVKDGNDIAFVKTYDGGVSVIYSGELNGSRITGTWQLDAQSGQFWMERR